MKYLGEQIPKYMSRITSENYKPLLSDIRKYLPFLGLIQHIEIVQMNILPWLQHFSISITASGSQR